MAGDPKPGRLSPYRIAVLAAAGVCTVLLVVDLYTARELGLTAVSTGRALGTLSTVLLVWVGVRAASRRKTSARSCVSSLGALLVAVLLGLSATRGLVGGLVVLALEHSPLGAYVHWKLAGLEGRRLARQHFRDGRHELLGFSLSEVFLAGAVQGGRRCQVLYIDQPTEDQREALSWPHGRYPERPPCIEPGQDAVACATEDGEVLVIAARILIAGCIIGNLGVSYNHEMTGLLLDLDDAVPAGECGLDDSWELPSAESHLGAFMTFGSETPTGPEQTRHSAPPSRSQVWRDA